MEHPYVLIAQRRPLSLAELDAYVERARAERARAIAAFFRRLAAGALRIAAHHPTTASPAPAACGK